MLILDSPLVHWMGLINVAPRHSELAEPGQAQISTLLSLLSSCEIWFFSCHDNRNKNMNDNMWTVSSYKKQWEVKERVGMLCINKIFCFVHALWTLGVDGSTDWNTIWKFQRLCSCLFQFLHGFLSEILNMCNKHWKDVTFELITKSPRCWQWKTLAKVGLEM